MTSLLSAELWSLLASMATVLAAVLATAAAVFALRQLREMTRTRHLEAMLRVFEMMGGDEPRMQRRFIFTELKSSPDRVTPEERWKIEQVSVTFDRIGRLVQLGLVPEEELFAGHCEVIIRCWRRLKPYIEYHRQQLGGRHAKVFEGLATLAEAYHKRHFPNDRIEIVDVWSPRNETET